MEEDVRNLRLRAEPWPERRLPNARYGSHRHQGVESEARRGDSVTLVMTLGEWEYRITHIPGSMRVSTVQEALEALDPEDEIVLYDSGPPCPASRMAFRI